MTVIGNGDIAGAIVDRPEFTYFASGVSNSAETRQSEFERERNLLYQQGRDAHIVYFSSLCVFYSDTPYARHKRVMEMRVRRLQHYTIVRLGNILWGCNPNTLVNHLRRQHADGYQLDIQPVQRVVHTLEEFHWTLATLPEWNCEREVPGRLLTVRQIVERYVAPLGEFYRVA